MTWRSARGMTLIEATIVITVAAVLVAAAAPAASRTLDRARITRAVEDAEAIKTAITNWRDDVFQGFSIDGTVSGTNVDMLVGDGDTPSASLTDDNGSVAGVQMRWDDSVNNTTGVVDFLERHLVTNNPRGSSANGYPLSGGNTWRGAYLNAPIDPDPWGNRYAVNCKFLRSPSNTKNDVIVLSAGPDEEIDTLFEKDGIFPGDDDIIVMILRDRNTVVP